MFNFSIWSFHFYLVIYMLIKLQVLYKKVEMMVIINFQLTYKIKKLLMKKKEYHDQKYMQSLEVFK